MTPVDGGDHDHPTTDSCRPGAIGLVSATARGQGYSVAQRGHSDGKRQGGFEA
jgi:hypothetical protein